MPPFKSKQSISDRRAKQRLCKKRKYAEIKNDPELLAVAKEKRREKYLKDKEAKKIKSISELSSRAQREQKKKWRENSKRYRERQKEDKEKKTIFEEAVPIQADPVEPVPSPAVDQVDPLTPQMRQIVRAAVRKVRFKERKKRLTLMKTIFALQAREKELIRKLKYNMCTNLTDTSISTSHSEQSIPINDPKTKLQERVEFFYLEDSNSTVGAGKKEFITRNKKRMQKRYLCQPLKELYKKFRSETNMRVSYSFFCRLRPFWVVFPRNINRDTCQCSIHANIELLIQALNKASILCERNYAQVLSRLCCDSRNLDCLQRFCDACKSNSLIYQQFSNRHITYYEWTKVTKEITLKSNRKKKQIFTEKKRNTVSATEAIAKLERDLPKFLKHTYKIVSQYKTIKHLKDNLNIHEACVHVDFSENYSLKYATEVQSFHFGGSRQQVSLHTAVIYTHSFITGKVTPTSMCTISECLRHDAPAIWSHLVPLIEEVIKRNTFIDTIHFLSDSPTSQYRNKYMFYVISQICKDFPQINTITWNYSEVGHGKGAPDGVGATLKRTADRMVIYGNDIGTFDQFYELLTTYINNEDLNIIVKLVEKDDILYRDSLIPKTIQTFKGTFSVYQLVWNKTTQFKSALRTMSCFECAASVICKHNKHLAFLKNKPLSSNENDRPNPDDTTSSVVYLKDVRIDKGKQVRVLSNVLINETNIEKLTCSTSKHNIS